MKIALIWSKLRVLSAVKVSSKDEEISSIDESVIVDVIHDGEMKSMDDIHGLRTWTEPSSLLHIVVIVCM